ncbi:MAG: DUF815 domain-containing protein [Desulfurella sp.]|jgi:predicted AAA+ superfamily ATPase|uniref:Uncharacterized protein n=1 Tax=Desulfurella multipotens TaxID=79269 RepID=A0A1G6N8F4_9BACT|nr:MULTISPECIES: DUF815 domain-containing protein [Desulfurella]PMP68350.1 MAG: DUF815 domain-containing protein [Desulfurella multipotens]PMP89515.1 MAG: DUF815 domain-containing protein [Desulfurella sp.]SDC63971.1 hypothetical protein SAMN05660835_01139 [Desulfurella multipotens]HEX14143.1 DUF815 domain-containing protein [Desulfurella acetivorans]
MFENHLIARWYNGCLKEINGFSAPKKLLFLDKQIEMASKNTLALVSGYEALNMFFYGENGLGKSSLVKYLIDKFSSKGLRCIEYLEEDIYSIYELFDFIKKSEYKFFIYFDDLAFEDNNKEFRKFKSIIEGSLEEKPKNCIFLITSNKKRLIKQKVLTLDSNIFEKEEENEKLSLFSRFGLSIGFYPLELSEFLEVVNFYLNEFNVKINFNIKQEAQNFALGYGIYSGRVAKQFALLKFIEQFSIQ